MRLDSKIGRWLFIGSGIMLIIGTILLMNGSKPGLFFLIIGGSIFFIFSLTPVRFDTCEKLTRYKFSQSTQGLIL